MTSQDLAAWFDVSYGTFRNKSKEYLEKLKAFADYEKVHGGVFIKEIYFSYYQKHLNKEVDIIFTKEICNSSNKLATVAGMVRKYEEDLELSENSLKYQFTKSRDKLFGTIKGDDEYSTGGIMGNRSYRWVIKVNDFNKYRELNEEESELFSALIKQTYSDIEPERIKAAAILEERFKHSDMSKEEYFALKDVKGLNFFYEVIDKFKVITGYQIVCGNRYDINYNEELDNEADREYRRYLRSFIEREFGVS